MGLFDMFVGGMVASYLNEKDNEKKQQEQWEKQWNEFERQCERENKELEQMRIDLLVDLVNDEIFNAGFESAQSFIMPALLGLFDINPTGNQIKFISEIIKLHPFVYLDPYNEAVYVNTYTDCFQNGQLNQNLRDKAIPDVNSYVWSCIFKNKSIYDLEVLKHNFKLIAWNFYYLNNISAPYTYSPSIEYPDNPLTESYISLIDLGSQLYRLDQPN